MKLQKDHNLAILLSAMLKVAGQFSTESIKKLYKENNTDFDQDSYNQILSDSYMEKLENAILREDTAPVVATTTVSSTQTEKAKKLQEAPAAAPSFGFDDLF